MAFNVAVVGIYMVDDKYKVKQAVPSMGTTVVGGAFWGILIGMFALFLLIEKWTEEKVLERLNKFNATIIRTSLTKEEEEKLKVALVAGE